eukprot:5301794-Pleurochrysis_carterae.AAC.1
MGRAIDILERTLAGIAEDGQMLLDENCKMRIFAELERELPPLAEYIIYMYCTKRMELAGSSVSEHHFARLRQELFSPEMEVNKETESSLRRLCLPSSATRRIQSDIAASLECLRGAVFGTRRPL